ncbi:MAG: DUF3971 domain-containing protein [Pseudomonadota bacterium]
MLRNSKFKTFVWYTGVGLLVLFAVAVSLFRIYFSSVEEYRVQLETIAGSYIGQPVSISGMDARVVGISPTVIFSDVALLQKGGESLLTRFDAISISLDLVASLRNVAPIIELTVSGANLEVTRHLDGHFDVKGLELSVPEKVAAEGVESNALEDSLALGAWFLSQSRLAVRDSRIILNNKKSGERFSFDDVDLELRNDADHHRLNGFVHLPKNIGRELRVSADIEGDLLQRKGWRGAVYVKTEHLQSRQWLQQLSWQGSSIRSGLLDLELWSNWEEGELESVYSRLQVARLKLARGEHVGEIPHLSVDGHLQLQQGGWSLDMDRLQIQHDETLPLPVRLALTQQDDNLTLQVDQLQLEAVAALLPYLPQLNERSQSMVRQMAPAGVITGLRLQRSADQHIEAQGALKGLALMPWEKLPGVEGLNAQFRFNGDGGQLQLNAEDATLTLPRLFRAPLALSSLNGELRLRREPDGWRLFSDSIAVANSDLSAQLGMELQLLEGSAPWLSLQGRFSADDVRAVPHYLPAGIMKERSLHWLDNAFKAGRVPNGSLQYHGFLNHFPFREARGRFEVLFDAEAVQLHYGDAWPDLQQLAGEVHFDGPGMWIDASGARLFDAKLGSTNVSIDNFRSPRLLVDGGGVFPAKDGLRFLRESPLSKNTGKMLDTMRAKGDVWLGLQLAIPLSKKVQKVLPVSVRGKLDFVQSQLDVIDGISLTKLDGRLNFTENSFSAERITAQLFGKPLSLDIFSEEGDKPQVVVAARGGSELSAMRDALKLPLLNYLEGSTDLQARLSLPRGVAGEGVVLNVSSNLLGVSSRLPQPLVKQAESSLELDLTFHLSGVRGGEGSLTLGDELGLVWKRGGAGKDQSLRRLQLRMGSSSPLNLPARDVIEVVGEGGKLHFSGWRDVLQNLQPEGDASRQPLPVVVSMQQLHLLSDSSSEKGGEELKVSDLPAINFAVEQFAYDDLQLGRVTVNMVPQGEQMSIKDIHMESEIFSLSANGTWSEGGNTFFKFNLTSPSLGKMMRRFGFASVIQGGETLASGKVWWAGAPTAVTLAGLNAQLGLSIKDGIMVEVDPGAGRMLGILSLPALPRRLFLDFSDVFREGLAFDVIKGDIRIEQGQAYTSNLQLESTPASILISGRTGLVAQDFDQDIYVVPNVSDTVSVASALAWGPQAAALVVLLQEIFKSDIKAATMTQYHISGSWRDPVIKRIVEQRDEEDDSLFID